MPGLLRGVARTAAVAGTATVVSNRVSRRQTNRWAKKEEQQAYQQQPDYQQQPPTYAPPPAAAPAGDNMDAKLAQLKELGQLKEQGVLTDAEFQTQKSRLLNS